MGYQRGDAKKLLRAFRFAVAGADAESVCMKDDAGRCTGKSQLRWQDDVGHYTYDCPAKLLRENQELIEIWHRWKIFGNAEGKGWLDEPYVYVSICELLESEYNRVIGMKYAQRS